MFFFSWFSEQIINGRAFSDLLLMRTTDRRLAFHSWAISNMFPCFTFQGSNRNGVIKIMSPDGSVCTLGLVFFFSLPSTLLLKAGFHGITYVCLLITQGLFKALGFDSCVRRRVTRNTHPHSDKANHVSYVSVFDASSEIAIEFFIMQRLYPIPKITLFQDFAFDSELSSALDSFLF